MTKQNPLGISAFDAAEYLNDEGSIAEYLNASIEMDDPAVLLNALGTVARARSMSQLAEASGLGRESLYKALKPGASPRYDTVMKVLGALGLEIVVRAPGKPAYAKPAPTAGAKKGSAVTAKAAPAKPKHKATRRAATEVRAAANPGRKVTAKSGPKRRS